MAEKTQQLQIRVSPRQKAALKRLAAAAGQDVSSYVLARVLPPARQRFGELLALVGEEAERRFALAELNDLLASLGAAELRDAIVHADVGRLPPVMQNYVAALVEEACRARRVVPPSWTAGVPALERPHFAVPLRSLRLHLLRASPVAFKRRNLFVDAGLGARV